MGEYPYVSSWSKTVTSKHSRTYENSNRSPQFFLNSSRVPIPSPSYNNDIIKSEYLSSTNEFYGNFYTGFRPPIVNHNVSSGSFHDAASIRGFPKKNSINRGNFIQRPRKLPAHGKKYSVVGKTAAMVLNELYPDFKEQCQYQTIETPAKIPRFKCSLNVCGETYSAEGSSKKIAKQLACELALKRLRPDITLEGPSFEKAEEEKMNALAEQRAEKKRLEHSKMSNYLYDYFICLCQRKEALTGEKYQPIFDCSKLPSVSMNVTNAKRYLCTLTLSEQGRKYTKESSSKIAGQNCVIKEALLDLFNISLADLRAVEKTAIVLRPSHPMQVLLVKCQDAALICLKIFEARVA